MRVNKADTAAHELGHSHGRNHAPCGMGLDPSSIDPAYPHDGGKIGVLVDVEGGDSEVVESPAGPAEAPAGGADDGPVGLGHLTAELHRGGLVLGVDRAAGKHELVGHEGRARAALAHKNLRPLRPGPRKDQRRRVAHRHVGRGTAACLSG